jgi:hypothetical protein
MSKTPFPTPLIWTVQHWPDGSMMYHFKGGGYIASVVQILSVTSGAFWEYVCHRESDLTRPIVNARATTFEVAKDLVTKVMLNNHDAHQANLECARFAKLYLSKRDYGQP